MKEFIRYLRKGDFRITTCISCRRKTWPPSKRCQYCLSKTKLKRINLRGKVLEFSTSELKNCPSKFGIIQMNGVTLLGSISDKNPYYGMPVRMTDCGVTSAGLTYYNFERVVVMHKNNKGLKSKA